MPASNTTGGASGTTSSSKATRISGNRALKLAVGGGQVDIVRLLLQRALADPNAPDERGCTPLMAACSCSEVRVEVTRLLLEAGADPTRAAEDGFTPMHAVAQHGHTDLVALLHSSSPAAVNICAPDGETPLFLACYYGQEGVVSRLLSLGVVRPEERKMCPLSMAVRKGFVGVVRILVTQGMEAIGGRTVLPKALYASARFGQGKILHVLLGVDGEEIDALGVGQHQRHRQTPASLWRWLLLPRRGERSPRGWGGRGGTRFGRACPSGRSRGGARPGASVGSGEGSRHSPDAPARPSVPSSIVGVAL